MGVANHPDNLSWPFSEGRTCTGTDQDSIFQRVTIGPVLPGHSTVDNRYAGCGSVVQFREIATTQQWDFERIEVAVRNRAKASSTGKRRITLGSANNIKGHPE